MGGVCISSCSSIQFENKKVGGIHQKREEISTARWQQNRRPRPRQLTARTINPPPQKKKKIIKIDEEKRKEKQNPVNKNKKEEEDERREALFSILSHHNIQSNCINSAKRVNSFESIAADEGGGGEGGRRRK